MLVTQPAECLVDGAMDSDGVVMAVGALAAGAPAAGAHAVEEAGEVLAVSTEPMRNRVFLLLLLLWVDLRLKVSLRSFIYVGISSCRSY